MSDEHRHDEAENERRMQQERRHGATGTMTEGHSPAEHDEVANERRMQQERRHGANPEAMHTEPTESQRTSRQMDFWPEMTQYRQRFDEIQAQFIEQPREAVMKAEQLVEEALNKMTTSMRERIQSMHRDAESGDTERLRVTMKSLRDFIESLGARRAA